MTLPDVNVWIAGVWGRHRHHAIVREWFDQQVGPLVLCRVTQMALLRLMTNPAVVGDDALTRRAAWEALESLTADPRIRVEREPQGLEDLWKIFSKRDDRSHLLWTDDYLAAFAQAVNAELVTLDRAWRRRYASVRVKCLL